MPDLVPIRRALISVSDKTGVVDLARALAALGVEIVTTGGTARALAEAGVEIARVEDLTGLPEMMEGRVKTLHPAIHGAVLARRDVAGDVQALADHGLEPIDLVVVNLYPFEDTAGRAGPTDEEVLEQIDIGGPALLRASAKNHRHVAVVTSPQQYDSLVAELRAHGGATTAGFRRELATAAFDRTARYDAAIAEWFGARAAPAHGAEPQTLKLRYGENPHQAARLERDPAAGGPGIASARVLGGKRLSYNNVLDAASALETVQDLHAVNPNRAAAVIVKHTDPCGAAIDASLARAFDRAYEGDPRAAYGGILAVSRPIDAPTAERICAGQKFLEVIVAPEFEDRAFDQLAGRWTNVRLLAVGEMRPPPEPGGESVRSIPGGMLVQDRDTATADPSVWKHVAGPPPGAAMLLDAAFTWTVCKHLRSNAVAIGAAGCLLGAGSGQVDRLSACRLAVEKAGDRLREARAPVAASEAFFPFADGPQVLIDAGVRCIVHPGGSKRDEETIVLCDRRDVTCLITGIRHFRH